MLRAYRGEVTLRRMLSIAFPMIASTASETIMLFFNRYFVSFLGSDHIPASMSGGLTQFVFTSLFAGIVGYVNALAAQYHGARRPDRCLQAVSQGLLLSLAFYPVLLALIPVVHRGFVLAGHGPRQVQLEFAYFRILMSGSLLFLVQGVLTGYFVGVGRTRVVMMASVLGILVNVPLTWIFTFGRLGAPRLGIEGAALGTLGGACFIVDHPCRLVLPQPGVPGEPCQGNLEAAARSHGKAAAVRDPGRRGAVRQRLCLQRLRAAHAVLRPVCCRGGHHHLQLGPCCLHPDAGSRRGGHLARRPARGRG